MRIKHLKFSNFRNLNLEYNPSPGFNIISGENAQGKSNFLDGINILSTGTSFKSFKNQDNLDFRKDDEFAKLELMLEGRETVKLSCVFAKTKLENVKNTFIVNDKPTLRNKFIYKLKVMLFTPMSLEMVLGSPDIRRDEIDDLLSTFDSEFSKQRKEYSYVMRSRNRLLMKINQGRASKEQLTYWTDRLIKLGTEVKVKRLIFLQDMKKDLAKTSSKLFKNLKSSEFKLNYVSDLTNDLSKIESEYRKKIQEKLTKEILLGRTLYGPHRDDLEFLINDRNLHSFGSRGEQRLATMVFKMSSADYLTKLYDTPVVYLLDDIFSELDKENRKYLLDFVESKNSQVFITTANRSELPKELTREGKELRLGIE